MESSSNNIANRLDHLFRHETGKMISVISRIIGFDKIDEAEDIVQDTLLKAMQLWSKKGIPANPEAWLYTVAKNKAIDNIRKNKNQVKYQSEVGELLYSEWSLTPTVEKMFLENEIQDSQLRLIFACCEKSLTIEYQIPLILKLIAGFSSKEISRALLIGEETVNKRIYRAKKKLAENNSALKVPIGNEATERIHTVNRVIYLIFNEGYSSSSEEKLIRAGLVSEAIRLARVMVHLLPETPETEGLLALMLLHDARSSARMTPLGTLVPLEHQNRKIWHRGNIAEGRALVKTALKRGQIGPYQLQAAISALLSKIGYQLHSNASEFNYILNRPVPEIHREFELLRIHQIVHVLMGEPYKVVVDASVRQISFKLDSSYVIDTATPETAQ